jgi:hypothetical protein
MEATNLEATPEEQRPQWSGKTEEINADNIGSSKDR